jgi:hypothetical protein
MALAKAAIESQLNSRFGDVFKLTERRFTEVLPTGVSEIDSLSGGLPRGAITEIFGPASSGRTSLMLSALSHATRQEEACAVVDTNNSFDPQSASKAGADLEQLLWLRCDNHLEHAFKAADMILQSGGFGLVVLDLGDLPASQARKIISSWWYRFRRVVENKPTALLVIAQDTCVRSCASLSLAINKAKDDWATTAVISDPLTPRLLRGIKLHTERQRPILPGTREISFQAQITY